MTGEVEVEVFDDYLLVTIQDTVINIDRANKIIDFISEQCNKRKYNKVLLDERTVKKRDVTPSDVLKISIDMASKGLHKIYIAFLCDSTLINKDTKLLRMFTYTNEFIIQFFTDQDKAVEWLNSKK